MQKKFLSDLEPNDFFRFKNSNILYLVTYIHYYADENHYIDYEDHHTGDYYRWYSSNNLDKEIVYINH